MTSTGSPQSATQPASSADGVAWDLRDLYAGPDDPLIDRDLQTALQRAQTFETAYRGKVHVAGGPASELLATAMRELESLSEQRDRALVYASVLHSAQTDDPARGALLSRTREQATAVNQHLIFFDLEWIQVPDEAARPLMAAPALLETPLPE
jgi:oligoendopeptidase F